MLNVKYVCNPATAEEYISEVKNAIRAKLPDRKVEFVERDVVKNNGITLKGLTIMVDDSNASPTVYPYESFNHKVPVDELAQTAVDSIPTFPGLDGGVLKAENLYPRLINTARNKGKLLNMRYPAERLPGGTSVILCIKAEVKGNTGWIDVTEEILNTLGLTREEAFKKAYENLKAEASNFTFMSLGDCIIDLMGDDAMELAAEPSDALYILTNESKYYGASCILDKDTRKRIHEVIGDYYVLPSSVHEVLLVRASGSDPEELTEMVKSVNATTVADEDFLSDSITFVGDACEIEAIDSDIESGAA